MSRSVDPIHSAPSDAVLEINNLSNSGLYKSLSSTLTPPSTSTIPQDCPISSESDLGPRPASPVEVFEHIIDQSDDLDDSLCHLSLTCHAFLTRARLNLFFRIHIGHKEKLESAHAFFEARPWLPPLVHALTIRDYIFRYLFALHDVVPSRLITALPRLHILEFARDERDPGTYDIRRMRDDLGYSPSMLSILRKVYNPIQHLELTGINFGTIADFLRLICALPYLKSLTCGGSNAIQFESDGHTLLIKGKTLHLTQVVVRLISVLPHPSFVHCIDRQIHQRFDPMAMKLLLDMSQATLENLIMHAQQLPSGFRRTEDNTACKTAYYNNLALCHVQVYRHNCLADHSDMQESTMPTFPQLRDLHILTLVVEGLGGFDTASEILDNIPTTGASQHLNIVMWKDFLTPLVFNSINASGHRSLKTLEQSIIRFKSLRHVVFTPPRLLRKNRRGLWDPALGREFSLLKARAKKPTTITADCDMTVDGKTGRKK